jgi:hypothetical protein
LPAWLESDAQNFTIAAFRRRVALVIVYGCHWSAAVAFVSFAEAGEI